MFDIVHQCGATLSLSPDSFDDGKSHGQPYSSRRRSDRIGVMSSVGTLLPRAIRRHVRSWRKRTLHRHRNMCEEGQSIAELEAEIEALQRQALALGAEPTADFAPWVFTQGEDRPMSAFGGRRHAGAERVVGVSPVGFIRLAYRP
jgi:hypothetical protein